MGDDTSDRSARWRIDGATSVDLDAIDPDGTPGAPGEGSKHDTRKATATLAEEMGELQNRLWAEKGQSVLLVLQAMDAGGKDGTVKTVCGAMNPMGLKVQSFKAPSEVELGHDFLWRIHAAAPEKGEIGVFNRSHYEDVLIARVDQLVSEEVWRPRFGAIRDFERMLTEAGTTIVKVYLHISRQEQAERFRSRLTDPSKLWKFNRADLDVRHKWSAYRRAYKEAINETATDEAPWYVVPADHKWYRNWAVSTILAEALRRADPQYPAQAEDLSDVDPDEL